jgi:single-strand DNA-binding protein
VLEAPVRSTVTLSGNVVSDVTLRATSGGPVAGFRMAVTESWWDKRTERWAERVTYLTVSAWRQLGEHVADSVAKGQPVVVVGRLRQREYDDRDGIHRSVIEVDADIVGHDLSRGRASFVRRPRGPQTADVAAAESAYAEPSSGERPAVAVAVPAPREVAAGAPVELVGGTSAA